MRPNGDLESNFLKLKIGPEREHCKGVKMLLTSNRGNTLSSLNFGAERNLGGENGLLEPRNKSSQPAAEARKHQWRILKEI